MYNSFAEIYDQFMETEDYDTWYQRLVDALNKHQFSGKSVLDIACGTGEMTERLSKDGYKMMGLDLSSQMLEIAQSKAYEKHLKIHYIQQNILELEVFHSFDGMISFCDGFNYILDYKDLDASFHKIYENIKMDGFFIFDMSSDYKLKLLDHKTIAETSDDAAFIWENYYDEETRILEFDLTFFKEHQGSYQRFEEQHKQRAYSIYEIETLLKKTGFSLLELIDTQTGKPVTDESERWLFICRK